MTDKTNNRRVVNPHDKLFRKVNSDLENARSVLKNYLPDRVVKLMDLSTLEISKDSFIEADLRTIMHNKLSPKTRENIL